MANKRALPEDGHERPSATDAPAKKQKKKGFTVGPANLPDGTYRRKAEKIKKDLIHKAKVRKEYAKVKEREAASASAAATSTQSQADRPPSPTTERHPDREAMLERPASPVADPRPDPSTRAPRPKKVYKPKQTPYANELRQGEARKVEAERRRAEYEAAQRQRTERIDERERFRRAMAKARQGGKNGQRKLGRESGVLLERVRRVVGS
ncbi:MAG: Aspartate aminotransferase, cytoplasmic [Chaenotheca gracillima]|nr:MAG: Aspartate aminotransferase, cytoplasmic [Chaenotheca gracillima]